MSAMSEAHADLARAERIVGPIYVKTSPAMKVRYALDSVVEQAYAAAGQSDLNAMLRELNAVRDACISAAITIKAAAEEARSEAIKHIGKAA